MAVMRENYSNLYRSRSTRRVWLTSLKLSGVKLLIILIVIFGMLLDASVGVISYVDKTGSLTAFPHDIPYDVEEIDIRYSHIPIIEYIDPLPDLQQLRIIKSSLEEFPDLSNVSNSLSFLSFYGNELRRIDWIAPMKKLVVLDLSRNYLTSLPDLSNVSSNLFKLALSGNKISCIESFPVLPALGKLSLAYNILTEVPDLRNISSTLISLSVKANHFTKIDPFPKLPKLEFLAIGGKRFAEFPDITSVNSSLEEIWLELSKIEVLHFLPKMCRLKVLKLRYNRLQEFPDLTNVSATLTEIEITSSEISTIDFIPPMEKLNVVILSRNRLTEFPKLSNITKTLSRLELAENEIGYVPEERVLSLKALTYLDLRDNPISWLPNFCYLNNPLELLISGSKFTCDWHMAFIKLMETGGNLMFSNESPNCTLSGSMVVKPWSEITMEELLNEPVSTRMDMVSVDFKRLDTNWSCPFYGEDIVYNVSAVQCGAICRERSNCLMYAADQGRCVLTNHELGTFEYFNKFYNWYIRF